MAAVTTIARASILGTVPTMAPFLVFPEAVPLELVEVPSAADVEL
jgi:hypothetical protein